VLAAGIDHVDTQFDGLVAALAIAQLLVTATAHSGNGWSFTNANGAWEYPVATALVVALLGFRPAAMGPQTANSCLWPIGQGPLRYTQAVDAVERKAASERSTWIGGLHLFTKDCLDVTAVQYYERR
jgi:hypothetical protein